MSSKVVVERIRYATTLDAEYVLCEKAPVTKDVLNISASPTSLSLSETTICPHQEFRVFKVLQKCASERRDKPSELSGVLQRRRSRLNPSAHSLNVQDTIEYERGG